jgi:DNA-binding response OmpR family regulator
MMPKKTGFEVCQEVRALDVVQGTKIIMLTAKGRDTDVAKGLALGADAYMTKPFATRELVQKVAEMLGTAT